MSGDGAHQGVDAERALGTILGGDPRPSESEQRTPAQMRVMLLAAHAPEPGDDSYGQACNWMARLLLELYQEHPELVAVPITTEYDWDADPDRGAEGRKPEFVRQLGLWDVMKADHPDVVEQFPKGHTGFMWGWAVNAARYCIDAPAEPNPALIDL